MRFTEVFIDRFGRWQGLELRNLPDGLLVLFGPNEAGKSTLVDFIRGVLFGFTSNRRSDDPARAGEPVGGSLRLAGEGGSWTIRRHETLDASGAPKETLSLLGPKGTTDLSRISTPQAGLDDRTFANVFAVGLEELAHLGTLDGTAAVHELYKWTAGLDSVSLSDVMRDLAIARNRVYSASGPSQWADLEAERERLTREKEALEEAHRRYGRLEKDRDRLASDVAALEGEVAILERESRLLESALCVKEHWAERERITAEIAALAVPRRLPADARKRLDRAHGAIRKWNSRHEQLKNRLAELRRRKPVPVKVEPTAYERCAPRIRALVDQAAWSAGLESQIRELKAEILALETEAAVRPSGPAILKEKRAAAEQPRAGRRDWRTLARIAKELRRLSEEAQAARTDVSRLQEERDRLAAQVKAGRSGRQERDLQTALNQVGETAAQWRKRIRMDERSVELDRHREDLREGADEALEEQLVPVSVLWAVGMPFVLGIALLLAGLFLPESALGNYGWVLALLGLATALVAAGWKWLIHQQRTETYERSRESLERLENETEEVREERRSLDRQLPKGGGSAIARLKSVEQELAALEALLPADARRRAAEQELSAAQARLREKESQREPFKARWRNALVQAGLSPDLDEKAVRRMARSTSRDARPADQPDHAALRRKLDLKRQELGDREKSLDALGDRLTEVLMDAGLPAEFDGVSRRLDELRMWAAEKAAERPRVVRRPSTRKKQAALSRSMKSARRRARVWKRRRARLIRRSGAEDVGQFLALIEGRERKARLETRRQDIGRDIDRLLAGRFTFDQVREPLERDSVERIEDRSHAVSERLEEAQRRLRSLHEARGRLYQEIDSLGGDHRRDQIELSRALVDERLRQARHRWQVLAATGILLTEVRRRYEAERQPEVLRRSSALLERMTCGRYPRLWASLDDSRLWVSDDSGRTLSLDVLSRGAREQVFLCLRLALVDQFAQRGKRLPVVLDDVLVNFDTARAKAAAAVLKDFAEAGHQVILFTCHDHIVKTFRSIKVPVRELRVEVEEPSAPAAETPAPSLPEPAPVAVLPAPPKAVVREVEAEPIEAHRVDQPKVLPPPVELPELPPTEQWNVLPSDELLHEVVVDLPPIDESRTWQGAQQEDTTVARHRRVESSERYVSQSAPHFRTVDLDDYEWDASDEPRPRVRGAA